MASLSVLKSTPEQNHAIKLTPLDEQPVHSFQCECEMCTHYTNNKIKQILKNKAEFHQRKVQDRINRLNPHQTPEFYLWVLNRLLLPRNKICTRGIEIFISQTCFYTNGEPRAMFLNKELNDITLKKITKDKINNTVLQKLFNQRRRKYRQLIAIQTKTKITVKKKPQFGHKKQVKHEAINDAVIVRYNDGYQQLMSQKDLITLMLRRKTDPFWNQIQYIKNYLNVTNELQNQFVIKYVAKKIEYESLFERCKILTKIYGQSIKYNDSRYITDQQQIQFMAQLRLKSYEIYGMYMIYKIVSFIEYFHDEKVNKIAVKFLINELGQCFLLQVYKLETQPLVKFNWTNQTYLKKIQELQYKTFYSKKIQINPEIQKKAKVIEDEMAETYLNMKNIYGLSVEEPNDDQEIANNKFFNKIHPQCNFNISDVFKDNTLTVQKFKKQYLGVKNQKRPVVKAFNSNLVKTLHLITPPLVVAKPHDLLSFTLNSKRTYSTNSRRQSRQSISYRTPSQLHSRLNMDYS